MDRAIAKAAVLLVLAAAPSLARAADPAPVVAAERAFAADGRLMAWPEAFKRHAAADGIMFAPGPVNAQAHLAAMEPRARPTLQWWPLYAGMALSGDLGFTTGPSTIDGAPLGQYFTVWARQADGRWRWALDAAPDIDPPLMAPPSSEPGVLAAGSPSKRPWLAVQAAERALAKTAATDAAYAYRAVLAPDARIAGLSKRLAAGDAMIDAELKARATAIAWPGPMARRVGAAVGGIMSASGGTSGAAGASSGTSFCRWRPKRCLDWRRRWAKPAPPQD